MDHDTLVSPFSGAKPEFESSHAHETGKARFPFRQKRMQAAATKPPPMQGNQAAPKNHMQDTHVCTLLGSGNTKSMYVAGFKHGIVNCLGLFETSSV